VQDARGDQCDKCGALMNPTDLINPRCKLTGTKPIIRSTRHLFLDLPKLSDRLQNYIDSTSQLGGWTANCMQVRHPFIVRCAGLRCSPVCRWSPQQQTRRAIAGQRWSNCLAWNDWRQNPYEILSIGSQTATLLEGGLF
jgi:hypothetical protein